MHIRHARVEELPYTADFHCRAMWDDEITAYVAPFREQYPLSCRDTFLRREKKRFYNGEFTMVAVTDEEDRDFDGRERIVGIAFYTNTIGVKNEESKRSGFLGNGLDT